MQTSKLELAHLHESPQAVLNYARHWALPFGLSMPVLIHRLLTVGILRARTSAVYSVTEHLSKLAVFSRLRLAKASAAR